MTRAPGAGSSLAAVAARENQLRMMTPGVLTVAGLLSVIAGILVIVYPDVTLLVLAIVAGVNLMILGVVRIVDAFVADQDSTARTLGAVVGLLSFIAGLIVVRRPGDSLLAVLVILGIWFVVDGLLDAVRGLFGAGPRGPLLLSGVAELVLGVLILSLPKLSLATLAVLVGIGFIVRGVIALLTAWRMRREPSAPEAAPATP
jgi:uncharacterized membrane protein HdeD (DUF308 family)